MLFRSSFLNKWPNAQISQMKCSKNFCMQIRNKIGFFFFLVLNVFRRGSQVCGWLFVVGNCSDYISYVNLLGHGAQLFGQMLIQMLQRYFAVVVDIYSQLSMSWKLLLIKWKASFNQMKVLVAKTEISQRRRNSSSRT